MKIKSKTELQDKLDHEYSWRLKEIHNLKAALNKVSGTNEVLFSKNLVILSYSHWEGFVKRTTSYYLLYISFLGLSQAQYSEPLRHSLIYWQVKKKNDTLINRMKLLRDCVTDGTCKLIINIDDLCDTESNLNYDTLQKIITNAGLSTNVFDSKANFINKEIVGQRNSFAHGDEIPIKMIDAIKVADTVLGLMRDYKTLVENAIYTEAYKV